MQDSFGKPEIKTFYHHTTCDLSCASVTAHVHCTQRPTPNLYATGVYCLWLIFTLHFVPDSKGNNNIIDVKKMCHVQQIAPSLRKNGKYFTTCSFRHRLLLCFKWRLNPGNTLSDKLIFKIFRGSMPLDPPEGSRLQH